MNLHEIEETLEQLRSRHNGLNEAMLVTLLRSGGWEEKNIQEALFLFRSQGTGGDKETRTKEVESLPPLQSEPDLPPPIDEHHLLLDHNTETPVAEGGVPAFVPIPDKANDPQSLVSSGQLTRTQKDEIPHNLPLRPFETSDHVWPFSRYRDVFYGDSPEPKMETKEEKKIETEPTLATIKGETGGTGIEMAAVLPPPEAIQIEPVHVPDPSSHPPLEKEIVPVPLTKSDEKLVILACVMLVAILLLLGYMYSNGRL